MLDIQAFNNYIKNIKLFDDIYNVVNILPAKDKGDIFEYITFYLFKLSPILNANLQEIWFYDDIPIKIKKELNLPSKDKGIDLLAIIDKKYYAIQCKYRQDSNSKINWQDISTFYGLSFGMTDKIFSGYFVTNTYNLCEQVNASNKVIAVYGDFFDNNIPDNFFENIRKIINQKEIIPYKRKIPLYHQYTCMCKTQTYFMTDECDNLDSDEELEEEEFAEELEKKSNDESDKDELDEESNKDLLEDLNESPNDNFTKIANYNKRGYIEMACGTGKSLTAFWIDQLFQHKITVVFVPSLYLLSQIYIEWVKESYAENTKISYILIGSDVDVESEVTEKINGIYSTTDVIEIKQQIEKHKQNKIVIICTYQSSEKLQEACKDIVIDFAIFDEAHKTVGQVNKKFTSMISDDNIKINKRLFMTATPKIYSSSDDNIISMDNEEYYGRKIYVYNTGQAITDRILVDYQIISIIAQNKDIEEDILKNKLVQLKTAFNAEESHYLGTILLILKKIHDGTCNHLVTYHNRVDKGVKFADFLEKVNNILYADKKIYVSSLDGKYSMDKRKKIIKEFVKNEKGILCSARVLNEGVNIPIIDGICFVDARFSTIDLVQCIGRGLRIHGKKKICSVLIPTFIENLNDEFDNKIYGSLIRILKALKESDKGIVEYFEMKSCGNIGTRKLIKVEGFKNILLESKEIDLNKWNDSIMDCVWKCIDNFNAVYEKLKNWVEENKRIPSDKSKNTLEKQLGRWCSRKRVDKKQNRLEKDKIDKLEKITGWYWKQDSFNELYIKLIDWMTDNDNKIPSKRGKNQIEKQLGHWCSGKKKFKKKGKLEKDKIDKLEKLPNWRWYSSNDSFDELHRKLIQWLNDNNKLPSEHSKNQIEKQLGIWCKNKRQHKKKGKLEKDKIDKLEKLPYWRWITPSNDEDNESNEEHKE